MRDQALRLALVVLCFGILLVPTVNTLVPFLPQDPVHGVEESAQRPPVSGRGLFDESFQKGFVAWYEQHYGARAWATRIDNSIPFHLFGELPPDKTVRVGRDGVLFLDHQVNYYNRTDQPDAAAFARKLKEAQTLLLARNKALVAMLMPTKAVIWPDAIPPAWVLPLGHPRPVSQRISEPFVREIRAAGAMFVDGRQVVRERGLAPDMIYTRVGRHLSTPATCGILDEAAKLARAHLRDVELPPLDCRYELKTGLDPMAEELDLYRVSNVWRRPFPDPIPVGVTVAESVARERRPNLLVTGTSFGWKVVYEAERNKAFRRVYYHYYGATLVTRGEPDAVTSMKLASDAWRDVIESSDMIVMPIAEEYLMEDGADFLDAVVRTYGTPLTRTP